MKSDQELIENYDELLKNFYIDLRKYGQEEPITFEEFIRTIKLVLKREKDMALEVDMDNLIIF